MLYAGEKYSQLNRMKSDNHSIKIGDQFKTHDTSRRAAFISSIEKKFRRERILISFKTDSFIIISLWANL